MVPSATFGMGCLRVCWSFRRRWATVLGRVSGRRRWPLHQRRRRVITRDRAAHDLDGNGAIEISELHVGVKRKVAELSADRQVPWLGRNEMVGDFSIF